MDQGAPTPRLTQHMTMGSLEPAAQCSCSCMYSRPFALVAVKTRAPTVEAEMQTVMAECSLSTRTYSARSWPLSTYRESISASCDWGVIG